VSLMQSLPLLAAALLLLAVALIDIRVFLIPNPISLAILLLWPAAWATGGPVPGLQSASAAFALVAVLAGIQWHLGRTVKWLRFGGGDWKLLSVLAPWAGLEALPHMVLVTALAGGAECVALLVARRLVPADSPLRRSAWAGPVLGASGVPYGVAIAIGGIVVILDAAMRS